MPPSLWKMIIPSCFFAQVNNWVVVLHVTTWPGSVITRQLTRRIITTWHGSNIFIIYFYTYQPQPTTPQLFYNLQSVNTFYSFYKFLQQITSLWWQVAPHQLQWTASEPHLGQAQHFLVMEISWRGWKKFREMSCSFYNTLEFYFYYGFELDRWIKHGYWTSTIFSLELV